MEQNEIPASQAAPAEQPQANAELAQMMALHLDGVHPQVQSNEPIVDTPPPAVPEPIPFQFEALKEKFGYEKPEDVFSEIEALRALKAQPLQKEEIKFENEASKKLYDAIQAGKSKEVADIISQQERLELLISTPITKDNAEDVIKMGMQLRYKDLTKAQIDHKFNKQFAMPKEPVQGLMDDEEFGFAKQDWEAKVAEMEMEREIEAKLLKPEIEAHKSKIVLPEIGQPIDEGYIQYKKQLEQDARINDAVIKEYQSFTPNTIETKVAFKDEANKIDFTFEYVPSVEKFASSKDMLIDMDKFFSSFSNQDGIPDRVEFAKAVHFAKNYKEVILSAITQAKNATIKSLMPDNDNGNGQRHSPEFREPSELEKQMARALN